MSEIIAFVHAKGSSERVPNKNLRLLGDLPLFCHAIAIAIAATRVTRVVIDSDSDDPAHWRRVWRRTVEAQSPSGDERDDGR